MANKFQRSVQERLAQESEREESSAEPKQKAIPIEEEKKTPTKSKQTRKKPNLTEYLSQDNKRQAKNKTFYLDTEVIDALRLAAEGQGVPESKLVNAILKRILLVE